MKKERKIARELNATMAQSVALEAREIRINELKWLYEAEGNLEEKKTIMKTMKVIILQDPPTYVNIDDSDDENPVSSYSSSAKVVKASSLTGDDVAHATPVTELWGEDADSDSGDEIDYDEPLCAMKENDSHFEKELSAMKQNYSHFEKENSAMKENDSHFEKEHSAMKENYSHFEKDKSTLPKKRVMKEKNSYEKKESDDDIDEVDFFAPEPPKIKKKSTKNIKK
jgi:hypothetical protein